MWSWRPLSTMASAGTVPSLQSLAIGVVAAHVDHESALEFCLPVGGSVDLLQNLQQQGRLRGDTLSPLLRASPDELAPILGSRLAMAASGCPALRDVAVQRLRHQPSAKTERLPDGTRAHASVDRFAAR